MYIHFEFVNFYYYLFTKDVRKVIFAILVYSKYNNILKKRMESVYYAYINILEIHIFNILFKSNFIDEIIILKSKTLHTSSCRGHSENGVFIF